MERKARIDITIKRKARIGITMDEDEAGVPPRRRLHVFWLYGEAIYKAGGVPVFLLPHMELVSHYGTLLSGLLVTGGDFDIDPACYGETIRYEGMRICHERTDFELAMTKDMVRRDKPVLGICGGAQVLNVSFGGSLLQDIGMDAPQAMNHEQPPPRSRPSHDVLIEAGTRLADEWLGVHQCAVNSAHHQAIARVGDGLIVNARAEDGIIEGIESPSHRFCVGVQWHPEFLLSERDAALFRNFVAGCL